MCETIGRTTRRARKDKRDVVEAVRRVVSGFRLLHGKVVDVQRRTEAGFAKGEATLEGIAEDVGRRLSIHFQNEHLVAKVDGEIVASVPDLITVLDLDTGEPVTTEGLRYGFRVVVLGIPCNEKWRTPAELAIVGPRYFGYDIDYRPVENRFRL